MQWVKRVLFAEVHCAAKSVRSEVNYSTVTDLARLRGLSTSVPRVNAA
jgi:hypothetical protein